MFFKNKIPGTTTMSAFEGITRKMSKNKKHRKNVVADLLAVTST